MSAQKRTTKRPAKKRTSTAPKTKAKRTTKPPAKKRSSAAPKAKRTTKVPARSATPKPGRTKKATPKKRASVSSKAKPKTRARKSKPPVRVTAVEAPAPKKAKGAKKAKRTKPALHTPICDLFDIEYPIIQTGMGWVSGASLTAATSQAGGLGILAAATMTFRELQEAIAKVKSRTDKPFGVNMRADQSDIMKRVELLIHEKVNVASFAQAPGERVIKTFKDAGVLTMPTIGARRHAEKVQAWGVDAVIAQGQEGGGHTGQVPTSILIPDVSAAVDIPVVAAGGFRDGRGLVAALALGGAGIAMGTRFLLTKESQVPDHVKQIYLDTKANGTVVTKAVDGYPQRVIRTLLIDQLEKANPLTRFPRAALNALSLMKVTGTSLPELIEEGLAMKQNQELTWAQLAMAANAPMLTKASIVDGRVEAGILPTGQVTGVIDEIPAVAELVQRIMAEAEAMLERLGA
ncbi:MAG: nitronate monooxygenase [Myxococcales bacterium]|nr:nitronate monooxygenase [Myxococcales bacterium]